MRYTILLIALAFVACKKKDPEPAPPPPPPPVITEAKTTFEIVCSSLCTFNLSVNWDDDQWPDTAFYLKQIPSGEFVFKFDKVIKQKTIHIKADLSRPASDTSSKMGVTVKAVKYFNVTTLVVDTVIDLW